MGAAKSEKYNGWTNYETWAVNLWIGNDEPSYRYWRAAARATKGSKQTQVISLANQLKDEFAYAKPDLGATVWADLLGAALSEVDWDEIAENLLGQ